MTKDSFVDFLGHHNFHVTGSQICETRRTRCGGGPSRYRSIDGSCNNLRNPSWGKTNSALVRLLEPNYSDGP